MPGISRSLDGTFPFIHGGILRWRDVIFPDKPSDAKWHWHGRCEADRSAWILSGIPGADERYGDFIVAYGSRRAGQPDNSEEIFAVGDSICAFCGSRVHDNDIIRMLKERRV